jgi:CBS domain containing-hemolysin-like protein
MLLFIVALASLLLALLCVVLYKTYFYIPPRELKRQADQHEPLAEVLWRAVGYGSILKVLLWLLIGIFGAIGLGLLSVIVPTVLAIITTGLLLLLTFAWLPNTRLTPLGGRLTVWSTPIITWLLRATYPLLKFLHTRSARFATADHTGLFQREDLLDLLERQKQQPDNRISSEEIDMAQAALGFGKHRVRDVLVPRAKVITVAADESISPVMLDELHNSLHARFPVHGKDKNDIVGTLYLRDVVAVNEGKGAKGKVRDVMHPHVAYINESDDLAEVLHTFYQTKQQLFVVINNFEEYVGILTLEDVLRQLLGQPTIQHDDQSEDRQAVAARQPKVEAAPETPPEEETLETDISEVPESDKTVSENSSEVVE